MNIAYITRARMPTEKAHGLQIAKMCEAYAALGHQVTLLVPKRVNPITEDVFAYYQLATTFAVKYLAVPDPIRFAHRLGRLASWLQAGAVLLRLMTTSTKQYDVIMTRSPEIAWWFSSRPVVCEVHDWPRSLTWLFIFFLRRCSLIVCNSSGTAQGFLDRGWTNVVVAHNGVDLEALAPTVTKAAMRTKLAISEDSFVVLYAGALQAWKGVETLLNAAAALPDCLVVIAGGAKAQVAELQGHYPTVRFLGTTPYRDLGNYQNIADLLVIPNDPAFLAEQTFTSPIKLFAHMASGVPILVTDLPTIRDVVSEKEVFFFDGTTPDLVRAIAEVRQDSTASEARAGFAKAEVTGYTWKNRAENIMSALADTTHV